MSRILSLTRYVAFVPVICIFFAATVLIFYGAGTTVAVVIGLLSAGSFDNKAGKELLLRSIEIVDLFLLGTVLYVTAIGLYELFIDDKLDLPAWLRIHDLDDLKNSLIGVVIVVLGVLFLGQVITWDGQRDLLGPGAATALVIAALAYFLSNKKVKSGKSDAEHSG